jgi:hypothetical protein
MARMAADRWRHGSASPFACSASVSGSTLSGLGGRQQEVEDHRHEVRLLANEMEEPGTMPSWASFRAARPQQVLDANVTAVAGDEQHRRGMR